MPVVQLGVLVALALAAAGPDRVATADEVATAGRPPAEAMMGSIPPAGEVVMGALPTPPKKVVLKTKTFGTVTVDHTAHLARRTSCRACHGDGPVAKISFTPRQAHDTCRACHLDLHKGPTDCVGCHVKPPEPAAALAPEGAGGAGAGPGSPAAPGSVPLASHGRLAGPTEALDASTAAPGATVVAASVRAGGAPVGGELPAPPAPPPVGEWEDEPGLDSELFRQSVEAGMVVRGGPSQSVLFGPSIDLTSRVGRALVVHHLESAGGLRSGRSMLTLGGGAVIPVRPRLIALLVATGGIDALGEEARILPAAGLRLGFQWYRALPRVELLSVSLSGVSDLVRERDSRGTRIGDVTFSLGVSAGFGFGGDR